MFNKIFNTSVSIRNQFPSKVKYNREYLISKEVSDELNTYNTFSPYTSFDDIYDHYFDEDKSTKTAKDISATVAPKAPRARVVRSIFNRTSSVLIGNNGENPLYASEWRISNNVPLMDSPENRNRIRSTSGCTVKELVKASEAGILGASTYQYSDFMYCKHLGKVSNSYMITLRRFAKPVDDFISSVGTGSRRSREDSTSRSEPSLGCMVTWLGTSGNEMSQILKYSMKMPFDEATSQWEDVQGGDADSQQGFLNSIAATFDPKYMYQYSSGKGGAAFNKYVGKMFGLNESGPYNVREYENWRDKNKVYGPVDAIKSTYKRSDRGLEFDQSFSLVFEYELRSYNGINGRQAMLDLISNILTVVYSTGTFWGGGYTSVGAHQSNIFTNLDIFKKGGDKSFTGYIDSFANSISSVGSAVGNYINKKGGAIEAILDYVNNLGGMILGGKLNQLGRPAKMYANSLLSPAPVGLWHVTIGNPHHPIMSIGNMIITNATVEHSGPLGLDDFPTGLKVTVELTRGKPRDIRDIEKLYMHGNDRIYTHMGGSIENAYKHAKELRGGNESYNSASDNPFEKTTVKSLSGYGLKDVKEVFMKYFGTSDMSNITFAAKEQEFGSNDQKKSK